MVVRLEGVIDGNPVIFKRKSGDWWETTIPANLNGVYVVELTAYDEAGNIGRAVRYIITVDLSSLCVRIVPYPYRAEIIEEYETEIYLSNFYAVLQQESYCADVVLSEYYAALMVSECWGVS